MGRKRRARYDQEFGSSNWFIISSLLLAERVGFEPVVLSPINDLGLIRSPQITKSTQNLSIRYKTGTVQSSRSRRPSRGTLHRLVQVPVCLQPHPQLRRGLQELRKLCVARRSLSTGRNHLSSWFQSRKCGALTRRRRSGRRPGSSAPGPPPPRRCCSRGSAGTRIVQVTAPTGSRTTCKNLRGPRRRYYGSRTGAAWRHCGTSRKGRARCRWHSA